MADVSLASPSRTDALRNAGGKSPAEVREMFARVARRYDLLNHLLSLGLDIRWRKKAASEFAGLGPNDAVADLCTGTGDLAFAVARASPQARILALDFTPEMVAYGSRKGVRFKAGRVAFGIGDALALPLRDGSAAGACVAFGIRNVGDLDRAVCELARVVRPGGKIVVLEFTRPTGSVFGPLYLFYLTRILPLIARLFSWLAGDAYRYLPQSIQAFAGPQELVRCLSGHGLKDVRAVPLTFGTVHLYVGVKSSKS